MGEASAILAVQVAIMSGGDAEEIVRATMQLRRELLDLGAGVVETPKTGEVPPGARAVDGAALGALVVSITDSKFLAAIVATVRSWLTGSSRRTIKLELDGDALELAGVSSKEQRRLTDEWLARHALGE